MKLQDILALTVEERRLERREQQIADAELQEWREAVKEQIAAEFGAYFQHRYNVDDSLEWDAEYNINGGHFSVRLKLRNSNGHMVGQVHVRPDVFRIVDGQLQSRREPELAWVPVTDSSEFHYAAEHFVTGRPPMGRLPVYTDPFYAILEATGRGREHWQD